LDLQGHGWPWLAKDLPRLQHLVLFGVRDGVDGQWPAGLADCTGVLTLQLSGSTAAPLPSGRYLQRLHRLHWLCDPSAPVPDALVAATALQDLRLTLAPERIAESSVLDALPDLRLLSFDSRKRRDEYTHTAALLELRRRLRAEVRYW